MATWEEVKPQASTWVEVKEGPEAFEPFIAAAAKKYNIDPLLIRAMIQQESGGKPLATSKAGAQGLMQLMPGTAKDMGVKDPFDPEQNIMGGTRYIRKLLDDAGGDVGKALLWYVGGRDPKNYGEQSFAYPGLVMGHYRKLGGRLMDWEVPKASALDVAANAVLPGVSAPEIGMRLAKGKMPWDKEFDIPPETQGQTHARAGFGDRLRRWWDYQGPVNEDIATFRKSIANYRDENPWSATGLEIGASLPAADLIAGGVQRGLSALPGPVGNFLAGRAGYGLPGTREGSNALVRVGSNAANVGVHGAAQGAAWANMTPDTPMWQDAAIGGGLGVGLGGLGTAIGETASRMFYGPKIDPAVAQLGQRARAGEGMPQLNLYNAPDQPNRLKVDPVQFSRRAAGTFGEEGMPRTPDQWAAVNRRVGSMFDAAAVNSHVSLNQNILTDIYNALANAEPRVAQKPFVKQLKKELQAAGLLQGMIPGDRYQRLTAKGSPLSGMIASADPEVRQLGVGIRNALQRGLIVGAQERVQLALQAGNQPAAEAALAALNQLRAARGQWKALKTVEEVASPASGGIAPGDLWRAVGKHYRNPMQSRETLPMLGRTGLAFDPTLNIYDRTPGMQYNVLAAMMTAAGSPVTTGQAGLTAWLASRLGNAVMAPVRNNPAFVGGLLNRSARVGPANTQQYFNRLLGAEAGLLGPMGGERKF